MDKCLQSGDLLTLTWDHLVPLSLAAIQDNDIQRLDDLDKAFRHFFDHELIEGTEQSRSAFLAGLHRIIESEAADERDSRFLTRWRLLHEIIHATRSNVDPVDKAARFAAGRMHAEELLKLATREGSKGLSVGDIARRLNMSLPHVSKLLRELEALYLVERHPAGKKTFVALGPVGLALSRREGWRAEPQALSDEQLRDLFGRREPLTNPLAHLAAR